MRGDGRGEGGQRNEGEDVARLAGVEVAHVHLVRAARRELHLLEERLHLLDLGAADGHG